MMVVVTQVLAVEVEKHRLILDTLKVEVIGLSDGVNVGMSKRDKLLLGFPLSGGVKDHGIY